MPSQDKMTTDELLAFLNVLSPPQRRTFEEMVDALKQPVRDLTWYLDFGRGVLSLSEAQEQAEQRGPMKRLSRALGCSKSLLTKSRDFARDYTRTEVRRLVREGITWSLAYPTFSVEDKQQRETWMLRARDAGWKGHQLERELQKANKGPQRKGGRPKRKLKSYGHVVDLQDLVRTCEEWLRHHSLVWSSGQGGLLDELASLPKQEYSTQLLEQLNRALTLLAETARAVESLTRPLHELRNRIRKALGLSEQR